MSKREDDFQEQAEKYADDVWKEDEDIEQKCITMTDYFAGAEYGYQYALNHPQWIPVEEELPKENEEVLAYNAENEEVIACDYHHKMFHCWPEAFKESITHWMPIVPPNNEK